MLAGAPSPLACLQGATLRPGAAVLPQSATTLPYQHNTAHVLPPAPIPVAGIPNIPGGPLPVLPNGLLSMQFQAAPGTATNVAPLACGGRALPESRDAVDKALQAAVPNAAPGLTPRVTAPRVSVPTQLQAGSGLAAAGRVPATLPPGAFKEASQADPTATQAAPLAESPAPLAEDGPMHTRMAPQTAAGAPASAPAEMIRHLTELLDERVVLKGQVRLCWEEVARSFEGTNERGMHQGAFQAMCWHIQRSIGVPLEAFGDLQDTYYRFDFNGSGFLDFNEVYRCVKRCMVEHRKSLGWEGTAPVPFKTPEEAGYAKVQVLASGGQGEAALVRNRQGEELVLKSYSKRSANAGGIRELIDEAENMQEVAKCPNIAKCHEIFQDHNFLFMVSSLNSGGDWVNLKGRAVAGGVDTGENWYRFLFSQAFNGLAHLHRNAIMHCDIKEPNLMIANTDLTRPHVVVIDLGLSQALLSDSSVPCGTPGYIPPETWRTGKWYPTGDMFSMGVVCAQMFTDRVPNAEVSTVGIFHENCSSLQEVMVATCTRQVPFHLMPGFPSMPFILCWLGPILEKHAGRRLRAPQVLQQPWFGHVDANLLVLPARQGERLQAPPQHLPPQVGARVVLPLAPQASSPSKT